MFHKINSQEPLSIITLDELKAQCRIMPSDNDQNVRLLSVISQASELAQSYVNKMLSSGDVSATWAGYKNKLALWGGNIDKVDSVLGFDANGDSVDIEGFSFNLISQALTIPTQYYQLSEFAAAYTVSPPQPSAILKAGTLHLAEYLFNNTSDVALGLTVNNMPITAIKILDAERCYIV